MQEYQYPLDLDWTTDEMVIVMKMWEDLERANEKGINNEAFLKTYQQFKTVVKSIGEEKRLGREFEKASGYSLSMMRLIFFNSSMRFFLLWSLPAVSQIRTSAFLDFVAEIAS